MITEVRIKNYQSIKEATVSVAPLTVFVGDNRAGKSAIQRAIAAACFNETGTAFIHRGQQSCEVTLVLDNGDGRHVEVTWTKHKSGSAEYLIDVDGEQRRFTKLGAGVPDEVQEELGFAKITVDKTLTLLPQIHTQGEYAFLIDKSPGQAARALAKLTRLDVVVQAQGLIRTDLRRARQDLDAATKLCESLETQLGQFTNLDTEYAALVALNERVENVPDLMARIEDARRARRRYKDAKTDAALELPSLEQARQLYGQLVLITGAWEKYRAAKSRLDALPETIPAVPAKALARRLTEIETARRSLSAFERAARVSEQIAQEIEEHDDETRDAIASWNALGVCTECGQPLPKMKVPA